MALANGTLVREFIGYRVYRSLLQHHVDNLRDDITGALDDDGVANADVAALADRLAALAQTLDIVLVVERRVGDHHAADGDRLKARHRRKRARAAHLDIDATKNSASLLGRKLVCNGPAGAARTTAQTVLEIEPVNLVDHTVNVVVELRAFEADGAIMRDDFLNA